MENIIFIIVWVSVIGLVSASPIYSGPTYFRHRGLDLAPEDHHPQAVKRYTEAEEELALQSLMNEILGRRERKQRFKMATDFDDLNSNVGQSPIFNRYLSKSDNSDSPNYYPLMQFSRQDIPMDNEEDSQEDQMLPQQKDSEDPDENTQSEDGVTSVPTSSDATTSDATSPIRKNHQSLKLDGMSNLLPPVSPIKGQKEYPMLRPLTKKRDITAIDPMTKLLAEAELPDIKDSPQFPSDPLMEQLDQLPTLSRH